MERALILYDLTGKVWNIVYGEVEAPQGMPSVWCDIPDNAVVKEVNPVTKEVIFEYLPETDLGRLQRTVDLLNAHVIENEEQTAQDITDLQADADSKADDITNIQIALAEVYEAMLGLE